jgi:uncharacterized protein
MSSAPDVGNLVALLRPMRSAILAYSGGLDSTFLLKALCLSGIRTLAVTGRSETTPAEDLADAAAMAREMDVPHRVIETAEMSREPFLANSPERCYHCKDELFGLLRALAGEEDYREVLDGSTVDDLADYRPGRRAAERHGVRSPLIEAGFDKGAVRSASRLLGLRTWDKPASPCLSSRFPYGTRITPEALRRVAQAEDYVRSLGFRELRVRDHAGLARLEVPADEIERLTALREQVSERLRELGYRFVSLDLEGLRSGSLNRVLE